MVALFLAAIILVAVLAHQAQTAVRGHRESREKALLDYARFANWELARQLERLIEHTWWSLFYVWVPASPSSYAVDLALVQDSLAAWVAPPNHVNSISFYFHLDLRTGVLRHVGLAPDSLSRSGIIARIHDHVRYSPVGMPSATIVRPEPSGMGRVFITAHVTASRFRQVAGRPRVLVYQMVADQAGVWAEVYGFEADAIGFVGYALRKALAMRPLLPPSLTRGLPAESLLTAAVFDRTGQVIFALGTSDPTSLVSEDTLGIADDSLRVRVSLRPKIAMTLLIGGIPASRLPFVLALLAATAVLIAVAFMQLRKESELTNLRSSFVAGVSHELRTPLAQIRLSADLLDRDQYRFDRDRQRTIRIIAQEARRLTHLVNNVLRFADEERNASVVLLRPTEIALVIREILDEFRLWTQARGARLEEHLQENLIGLVDRDALRQILVNLLENAVKYGPPGQRIELRAERWQDRVRISVSDQGPGIPAEDRERVWLAFHRLERDVRSGAGGSGIGLALVKELTELQGGSVWIEEGLGGGTVVCLEFPAAASGNAATPV